ncbi:N-acetyltransferase [Brevibacillus centrosporus]|nr:N-acetyltransferase [Brevibacillus centrosporus]
MARVAPFTSLATAYPTSHELLKRKSNKTIESKEDPAVRPCLLFLYSKNLKFLASIVLVPLEESHREELRKALHHPEIWEYTWRKISSEKDLDEIISLALEQKKQGTHIPFTILEKVSGEVIGTTRIGDIDVTNRNAEIGWTWLSPAYWRTRVNTECKYLLLQYCFEQAEHTRSEWSEVREKLKHLLERKYV